MNVERLREIVDAIRREYAATNQQVLLRTLAEALSNQVRAPQDPNFQQQVSDTLTSLVAALGSASSNTFAPSWNQTLDEIGLSEVLGSRLAEKLSEIFARNQITTLVARDEVTVLADRADEIAAQLQNLAMGLTYFGLAAETLNPGETELSVLIPRLAVKEDLRTLGTEFEELQKILGPFLELGEGSRPPLRVRTIASSDFMVYLLTGSGASYAVAQALDKILDVYQKIVGIIEHRNSLAELGVSYDALASVDADANSRMQQATERIAGELVDEVTSLDAGRANELKVELTLSLNKIANRIDLGYHFDVRVEPLKEAKDVDSDERSRLQRIEQMSASLTYINRSGKPILSLPEKKPTQRKKSGSSDAADDEGAEA